MQIIGIDIGTTSICGVVIDANNGKLIKTKTVNSNAFIKSALPFGKIQSPEKIITIAKGILDEFICEETGAIGITGQMHGIVYVNSNGKAISPLYTWQDKRGDEPYKNTTYAGHLGSCSGYGNVTDFYNRENGLRPKEAVSYCTIHDLFVMELCDRKEPLMHISDAASFGLFDLEKKKFSYPFSPQITDGFTLAGTYKSIGVSVAIGDNQASVFSTLANKDNLLVNVGTGSQVSVVSNKIVTGPDIEARPYFDGEYLIVGAALCGGRAYSILKNFFAQVLMGDNEAEVYNLMSKMIKDKRETNLCIDTRFAGTRANPDIKGSITGITTENFTPADLTLGVLEGMANELYEMYTQMNCKKTGIIGSGNGVRLNPDFVRILEDRFENDLKIPVHKEEAAVGAALFGGIAAGIFSSSAEAQSIVKYI